MSRRRWAFDLAVAALAGVFMTGVVLFFPRQTGTLLDLGRPALLGVVVLSTATLVFRRRAPVLVTVVLALLSIPFPGSWFGYVALYAAGAYARPGGCCGCSPRS